MKPMLEKHIQQLILQWLWYNHYFAVRVNTQGVPLHDGSGGFRPSPLKGIPDILFWGKGKSGGIEVKRKGGVISIAQKQFGQNLIEHGAIWIVAYSLEDVTKILS